MRWAAGTSRTTARELAAVWASLGRRTKQPAATPRNVLQGAYPLGKGRGSRDTPPGIHRRAEVGHSSYRPTRLAGRGSVRGVRSPCTWQCELSAFIDELLSPPLHQAIVRHS